MTPTGRAKPLDLRNAIADSIADQLKSYDVAEFCVRLGLAPAEADEDPFRSKRLYIGRRLKSLDLIELRRVAQIVLSEWDDTTLDGLLNANGFRTLDGQLRNLIFAADGPKPQIILRDALTNTIEITRGEENCLLFDSAFPDGWLRWIDLIDWWRATTSAELEDVEIGRILWQRLKKSLASEAERLLFTTYTKRYARALGFEQPALIPQVYLHYDPYLSELGNGALVRQRMDFLLLLPSGARVVIEVDGKHHYSSPDGTADAARYSSMVSEDRKLRLSGYEVYRFGGQELMNGSHSEQLVTEFFEQLMRRHL